MSDIGHSDYCPVGNTGDREDCQTCSDEMHRQMAYYGALYRPQPTEEEIMDAYSEPCERYKRDSLLERTQ